jgi:hypothetical protein
MRGQTNQDRHAAMLDRRMRFRAKPRLMKLGLWVYEHDHDITGAPRDLLESAFMHAEVRLVALTARTASARVRSQILWLGRWCRLINREMERARNATESSGVVPV